jgi:hypothetical protein
MVSSNLVDGSAVPPRQQPEYPDRDSTGERLAGSARVGFEWRCGERNETAIV